MYHIASQTVSGSVAGTVTFSGIPATYTHLQIRVSTTLYVAGSSGGTAFYLSSVNGSAPVKAHLFYGDGGGYTGGIDPNIPIGFCHFSPTPVNWGTAIIDILDYTNSGKNKVIKSFSGWDASGSGVVGLMSNLWGSASTISSLTFNAGGGSFAIGTRFDLYGISISGVTGA